ncbi:hypothetical protein IP78_09035 [Brevundimonas sp. AAP58]|nr:hypothetical protein IP78_09035 [Brevundimonas sp. AAP58]
MIAEAAAANAAFNADKVRYWMTEAEDILRRIQMLRSNAIAHRSAKLSRASAFSRAALSPDDLRRVVDEAEQIAYAIGRAFEVAPFVIAVLAPTELARIFRQLKPDE